MGFLRNLKVGTKLISGFIIVALIAGGIGIMGSLALNDMGNVQLPAVDHLKSAEQSITAIQGIENLLLVAQLSSDEKHALYEELNEVKADFEYHMTAISSMTFTAEEQELWDSSIEQLANWLSGHDQFIALSQELDEMTIEDPAALRHELARRQRDHYSWIWQLSESINTGSAFSGQTNAGMCALGLWLSSYETESEELNQLISRVETPHQAVHQAGSEIQNIIQAGEDDWQEQAWSIYNSTALPNMEETMQLITDMDTVITESYRIQNQMMVQALNTNRANYLRSSEMITELVNLKTQNSAQQVEDVSNFILYLTIIAFAVSLILGITISMIIRKPLKRLVNASERLAMGDTEVDLKTRAKDEIGELMHSFNKMIENTKENAAVANMIAAGDLSADVCPKSDRDIMANSMCEMTRALKGLVNEAEMLTEAAVAGDLSTRGDADKFNGSYKSIVEGVNKTLDAVIQPLNVAAVYVDRISKGDIPESIEDNYNGDFNKIKENLNTCINAVNGLIADAGILSEAALAGKLAIRADIKKHQGAFADIVQGVNDTLDAVIKPVQEASAVLSEMAKGNLAERVTGEYEGDHALIKDALNGTLDEISDYIEDISYVLSEMADANLNIEIQREYKGDFQAIKQALNLIISSFNTVLDDFNNAADQVAAGANQVSEGSTSLSQGTTEQASSIQELTASITQISAQTRDNANNANEANSLAAQAKDNAENGNDQMHHMLDSMQAIASSSTNISKIIKVIDDIAFQTNILALNAAVEAARAGQHGKGFAVVAEEVRNLAMRSAQAAKETTTLIEDSIHSVEQGSELANSTAKALDKIVLDITAAAELVAAIANSSNEQASAIVQVNEGVQQVSYVVQANSATAEQSAAASEELSSQASLLKDQVKRFSLKQVEELTEQSTLEDIEQETEYVDVQDNSRGYNSIV